MAVARADAVNLENKANEQCLADTNAAERAQDAALDKAKAKTLAAQASMAAAREREARLAKEAAFATEKAAVKAITKMAKQTKQVVDAKVAKKLTPAEAEKRALQEETKRELQAALIKANTVASGLNAKITKWKEMTALSESTGAQLKTKIDKVKQDTLNAENASRDHKLAMATQKAQAATKVKAADDENAKRRKLKREKKAAFAAKAEAERQLEVINTNNAKMQKRIDDLLNFLGKTTKEKHLAVADRFKYQRELTDAEIKTQKGKIAVLTAKKKYVEQKGKVQAQKTKEVLMKAKLEEKKAESSALPKKKA